MKTAPNKTDHEPHGYDSNRRLTDIIYPDMTGTHFDYDARGNKVYEENQYSARSYTHDELGRVQTVTDEILQKTIGYQYDQNGNRAKMSGPGGEETVYHYDAKNRIREMIDPAGGRTIFTYDKAGRRESILFPNGVRGSYFYDLASRLESIVYKNTSGDVLSSFAYTHDNAGNRLSKTFASGDSESYGYDDLHRLTGASYPGGRSVTYDYDPVGNRNFVTESWAGGGSETTTYTYSDFNQVLTTTNSQGTTTYGWDDNGNLAAKESPTGDLTQYAYNFENRLIGIQYPGGGSNAFGYDPQGIRVFKQDSQGRHNYLIDRVSVLAEFDGTGAKKAWYNSNPQRIDEILSQVQAAGKFYHLVDGLGSVYGLVNEGQVKVSSYSYDAYGALTGSQVQPGLENPFLFTGREFDADSGWQYNRARYYLSGVGSWNKPDPLSLTGDELNRFLYCLANPQSFVDPEGLQVAALAIALGRPVDSVSATIRATIIGVAAGYFPPPILDELIWALGILFAMALATLLPCGKWFCIARCNVVNFGGVPNAPIRVEGTGFGPNRSAACSAAISEAKGRSPRDTYTRHCHCRKQDCWRR